MMECQGGGLLVPALLCSVLVCLWPTAEALPHSNSGDEADILSRNVRDVDVMEMKKIFRENRVDRMEALNSFIKERKASERQSFQCTDCAADLAKGMDYRIVKSRNFIRMSRRIRTKSKTIANKAGKVVDIANSTHILKTVIHGTQKDEEDPKALCNGKWDHEHEEHEHGGHAKDAKSIVANLTQCETELQAACSWTVDEYETTIETCLADYETFVDCSKVCEGEKLLDCSCWNSNLATIDSLNAQCDAKKTANISKSVVQTMRNCGDVFKVCKNLEDEAIAYVAK